MTDEAKLAHLKKMCSRDPYRAAVSIPFLAQISGESWSIATDGRMLFAWRGKVEGVEERKDAPKVPGEWITKAQAASGATTAAALRDWAGAAEFPSMQDCSACKGAGTAIEYHNCNCDYCSAEDEETVTCFDCDGEKKVLTEPQAREGVIGGTFVNRNYFAIALDGIDGPVNVDPGVDYLDQVRMNGDGWIAIVMPLNRERMERDKIDAAIAFEIRQ